MAKRSKWLKWKVGGGVIVSLAVTFQVAKADPAFGQAVQAAQDQDDSANIAEEELDDQDVMAIREDTSEEKEAEQKEWDGVPSPSESPIQDEEEAHIVASTPPITVPVKIAEAPQKTASKREENKQASAVSKQQNSEKKHTAAPKAKTASSSSQKQGGTAAAPAAKPQTQVATSAAPKPQGVAPPADIPAAPPEQIPAAAVVEDSRETPIAPTEESTVPPKEEKTTKKKKSHSKSRHS